MVWVESDLKDCLQNNVCHREGQNVPRILNTMESLIYWCGIF